MLKFATFTSDIDLPFWAALASRKVDDDKLDDSPKSLSGFYEICPRDAPSSSCRMQIHGNALTTQALVTLRQSRLQFAKCKHRTPNGFCRAEGLIRNVNTIEDYRNLDKTAILQQAARTVSPNIHSPYLEPKY